MLTGGKAQHVNARGSAVAWRDRLPRGQTLPPASWARRHHAMTLILWLHIPALFVFALARGNSLGHSLFEIAPVTAFAIAAGRPVLGRRGRSAMVCFGLLTASSILVHLWDGHIEAHFHFFVMVTLLATYEEWFPYLLAFVYVPPTTASWGRWTPRRSTTTPTRRRTRGAGRPSTRCSSARWAS